MTIFTPFAAATPLNKTAMRQTLARSAVLEGVGVHGGAPARVVVRPAPAEAGLTFRRVDLPGKPVIPALYDLVSDTALCTTLGTGAARVSTVEHLMAALAACGVDDALIDINGPEVPIMDGSAAPFLRAILNVGLAHQDAPLEAIHILKPVQVEFDGKIAILTPNSAFRVSFEIEFEDAAIGRQTRSATLTGDAFARDYADSRTFGRLCDVEKLRAMGFAQGGSLDNAVVVDGGEVLNPGGLRHTDEFVRHKILDAVGDLALAGAPIIGAYHGEKAGHDMTNRLLRALFAQPDAWRRDIVRDRAACLPQAAQALELACA